VFTKCKGNALSSEAFAVFIKDHEIRKFKLAGADAVACIKLISCNMCKSGYSVTVLSDCITSYNKLKLDEMLQYYKNQGCAVISLEDLVMTQISDTQPYS